MKAFRNSTLCSYPLIIIFLLMAILFPSAVAPSPVSANWGSPVQITNSPGAAESPQIAVSGNNLYVVWADTRDKVDAQGIDTTIYFKRSTDGGITWGPDIRLPSVVNTSRDPAICISANSVHVVWADWRTETQVYYRRSTDGGQTWEAEQPFNGEGLRQDPRIAASGDSVYVVYIRMILGVESIQVKRSTNAGQTWDEEEAIYSPGDELEYLSRPDISASGSNVGVIWGWTDMSTFEVYFKGSANGGQTWGANHKVTTAEWSQAGLASVGISGNTINVIWEDTGGSFRRIFRNRSTDGGQTWGTATNLSDPATARGAVDPALCVVGPVVNAVWADYRNSEDNPQLFYNHSTDNGQSWGNDTPLTAASLYISDDHASLAGAAENLYVALGIGSDEDEEIYLIKYAGITSVTVQTPNGPVGFDASAGSLTGVRLISPGSLPCVVPGYQFPYGMFSFNLTGLTPGGTATVTISLPDALPGNVKYFKCQNGTAIDYSSFMTLIGDRTIRLTLTDGGKGDSDHTANGTIVDPGGPGFRIDPDTIPNGQSSLPAAPQAPVALANIHVQSASLSVAKVSPGTPVTITANVANTSAVNGSARLTLYINGQEEASQGITMASGGNSPVTFTVTRNEPGTYSVYVGGTNAGSFIVDQFNDTNLVLYISSILILFAFVIGVIYTMRRKQAGQ